MDEIIISDSGIAELIASTPDVAIVIEDQHQDVVIEGTVGPQGPPGDPGIAVGTTPPAEPAIGALWVDLN